MITVKVQAEIRTEFYDEQISLPAKTVNGVQVAPRSWRKRYYHAEVNGVPCMIRLREGVPAPENLKKGQIVTVGFSRLELENDVSQIWATSIEVSK